ncbi:MAG TPA: M24 family metallopeptidase [Gemmatimonadales bacterium]|nr:M24 family metallopeptidase [Gemmatimonadales bacterium]
MSAPRSCVPLTALFATLTLSAAITVPASSQEARRRYERLCQMRHEKFDRILPEVMRENGADMWIIVMREGLLDPMWQDLGGGYVGGWAYWIFTDRGTSRIERAVLGAGGYSLERCGVYDRFGPASELRSFVAERNPRRIAVNMSQDIGLADGLSHTSYQHLTATLGESLAARLVSAEKLFSDYRSRHTATEIAAMAEAGEISRELAERALSNEIITPGVTTLEDVAWWMWDQLSQRGLGSSFDMPSVYITGPNGIEATSTDRVIRRGDLLMIDWGVGFLGQWTDMKRIAYVLREGETEPPPSYRRAFDNGVHIREIMRRTIRPGRTAQQALDETHAAIEAAGFKRMAEFNRPSADTAVEFIIGPHSVGDWGHGSGPSLAFFNPKQLTFELKPTNFLSIELFAYTPIPEWGGKKLRIPLEDDAVVTERGVEWLYPVADRIRVVR